MGLKTTIVWAMLSYPIGLAILALGLVAMYYIGILGGVLAFAVLFAMPLLFPLRKVDS